MSTNQPAAPQYTTGPLVVEQDTEDALDCWDVRTDAGDLVATFWIDGPGGGDLPAEANARLFAAAPDLLDALRAMHDAYVNGATGSYRQQLVQQAEAAVAKALGDA